MNSFVRKETHVEPRAQGVVRITAFLFLCLLFASSFFITFGYVQVPDGVVVGLVPGGVMIAHGSFGWNGKHIWAGWVDGESTVWWPRLGEQGRGWIDSYPLWPFLLSGFCLIATGYWPRSRPNEPTCQCGYCLLGNQSCVCPECGRDLYRPMPTHTTFWRLRARRNRTAFGALLGGLVATAVIGRHVAQGIPLLAPNLRLLAMGFFLVVSTTIVVSSISTLALRQSMHEH